MNRRETRENTFKIIFEYCVTEEKNQQTFDLLIPPKENRDYFTDAYDGTIKHYNKFKEIISLYSKDFNFDRIFKIDLAVLMLSIYEILYTDIPDKVSVNEALELAKKYSTEKSGSFINGILASVITNKESILNEDVNTEVEKTKEDIVQEQSEIVDII